MNFHFWVNSSFNLRGGTSSENYFFSCMTFWAILSPFFQVIIILLQEYLCVLNVYNHHFQLLAWEPGRSNEVTSVTVRPNFQDSVHVGYISGLKKFTEYHTSVLCFTTPGDGPRSPPQRLRTHEDSESSRFRILYIL